MLRYSFNICSLLAGPAVVFRLPLSPRPWGKGSMAIAPRAQGHPQRLMRAPSRGDWSTLGPLVAPPGSRFRPSRRGRRHPGGCRDPWPLPAPPPPVHNGPAPAPCPARPWSPARASWPTPAAAPGSLPLVPLFPAPGGDPATGTPTPPGQDALSGNFFKKSFPGNYPRVMGPGTNILYMADWRALLQTI